MTRAQRIIGTFVLSSTVWLFLVLDIIPIPLPTFLTSNILPILPFYLLISFGSYALCNIGYNLMTFRECPDEYYKLMSEISESKQFLLANGIKL
ncbi:hypothetical protein BB560_005334 [Smittium megazygosporum]|uniref:Dolichol-phosphate mannosyltransferase subunit 3 n=1 Tax=Smittium megazygosporum TaxID=133381 RepID=A0A2T9Z6U1_9FUNG|nr:hypothetical protein BB560_005334 [Smittium megazygosporum]